VTQLLAAKCDLKLPNLLARLDRFDAVDPRRPRLRANGINPEKLLPNTFPSYARFQSFRVACGRDEAEIAK
jgi:hypothetical protein